MGLKTAVCSDALVQPFGAAVTFRSTLGLVILVVSAVALKGGGAIKRCAICTHFVECVRETSMSAAAAACGPDPAGLPEVITPVIHMFTLRHLLTAASVMVAQAHILARLLVTAG